MTPWLGFSLLSFDFKSQIDNHIVIYWLYDFVDLSDTFMFISIKLKLKHDLVHELGFIGKKKKKVTHNHTLLPSCTRLGLH